MKQYIAYIIVFLIGVIGIGALVFLKNQDTKKMQEALNIQKAKLETQKMLPELNPEWVRGNNASKVEVMEFADFQCPACKSAYDNITEALVLKYDDKIKFVFKQYPLENIHANALHAAIASEIAGKEGKFWEYYKKLYEGAPADSTYGLGKHLTDEKLIQYAKELGIDETKFKTDLENLIGYSDVYQDQKLGDSLEITGTPSFFVNKVLVTSSLDAISAEIDKLLK